MNVLIMLADGFEEIEALTTFDVLRRAGAEVTLVSVTDNLDVVGAHGLTVMADMPIEALEDDTALDADALVLPGGMPGATNLADCKPLCDALCQRHEAKRLIAAICASPAIVLAPLGILLNRQATCYPGMATDDPDIHWTDDNVAIDGHIITGRGPALATDFALALTAALFGRDIANEVASGMLVK